jgi:outer membrane protein OmpA-like peptidoglycan-associated protein
MRGGTLFLRGSIKTTSWTGKLLLVRARQSLLLFALLLQSCALTDTNTKTSIVPGKELYRTSQGFREVENKVVLKEITPYSVNVTRHICEADFISVLHQGELEIVHERRKLFCDDAYPQYAIFQVTAFGVPFLYDMVTGFKMFRKMCEQGPPEYSKETRESDTTVTQEKYDDNTRVCRDVPVSAALVSVKIDDYTLTLVSAETGTASLSTEQLAVVQTSGHNVSLDFQYENETKTTTFKQPDKKLDKKNAWAINGNADSEPGEEDEANRMSRNVNNIAGAVDQVAKPEAQMMARLDEQNARVTKGKEDSGAAAANADPEMNKISRNVNKVAGDVKPTVKSESQMMAKLDDEYAAVKSSKKNSGATSENAELAVNKISRNVNKIAGDVKQTAKAETEMMARLDDQNAALKNKGKLSAIEPESRDLKVNHLSRNLDSSGTVVLPEKFGENDIVETKSRFKVEFASNKAVVGKEYRDQLKKLAGEMKKNPGMITVVEGHTDNIGSAEVNRKISLRRASVIKDYMVKKLGVPASQIQVKGHGFAKPVADNGTVEGRAKNRRTEIRVAGSADGL